MSHWFADFREAQDFAELYAAAGWDVYFGMGLSPANYGPNKRCPAADVVGIPGLWAEIDVADSGHTSSNLPATQAEAVAFLNSIVPQPTWLVNSGGGVHAHWQFKETWLFDDWGECAEAADLEKRWVGTIQAKGQAHGWKVDSVGDLARVMRVTGTLNYKLVALGGSPRPVEVLEYHPDRLYNPSDFDEYLLAPSAGKLPRASAASSAETAGGLVIRPNAVIDRDLYDVLTENHEKEYQRIWEYKRRDLNEQGCDPSAYDMALACLLVKVGATDQQIADAIVHLRRHQVAKPKTGVVYYALTIDNARIFVDSRQSDNVTEIARHIEELKSAKKAELKVGKAELKAAKKAATKAADAVPPNPAGLVPDAEMTPEERAAEMAALSVIFGAAITAATCLKGDATVWTFKTTEGDVILRNPDWMGRAGLFISAFGNATGRPPRELPKGGWHRLAARLAAIAEIGKQNDDATTEGRADELLSRYLRTNNYKHNIEDADVLQEPWVENGLLGPVVHLFTTSFARWVFQNTGEVLDARDTGVLLRSVGCTYVRPYANINGQSTTRGCWLVPYSYTKVTEVPGGAAVLKSS